MRSSGSGGEGGTAGAADRIAAAVTAWPGVEMGPHQFGAIEFRLGRRELGHLHGDRVLDVPFPRRVRDELIAAGSARRHHWLPDSGWVTLTIESAGDVDGAIALLRRSYDRAVRARTRLT